MRIADRVGEKLCSVRGCCSVYRSKGFCDKHYKRWVRYGDPKFLMQLPGPVGPGLCHTEGCKKDRMAHYRNDDVHYTSWCALHVEIRNFKLHMKTLGYEVDVDYRRMK